MPMFRSLHEIQAAFAAHIAGTDRPDLAAIVDGAERLRLHRRHTATTLQAALSATFPTVAALVGEAFFGRLAGAFVAVSPPEDPVLSRYGEAFSDFIAADGPARSLPYLPDVARLDWALNDAFHTPFERRLLAADLMTLPAEALPGLSLDVAPGTAVISSIYPLEAIWQASQPDASDEPVDLASGPSRLLVFRRLGDAAFARLSADEAVFISKLMAGATLGVAAEGNLASSFGRLLGLGVFLSPSP
jgi:hypothetical protein